MLRRAGVVDAGGRGRLRAARRAGRRRHRCEALPHAIAAPAARGRRTRADHAEAPTRAARRPGVRGDVPARRAGRRRSPRCATSLGGARRLAGRRRRRADLERPRPRRRRRRRDRGRRRGRAARTGSGSRTSATPPSPGRPRCPPRAAASSRWSPAPGSAALFEAAGATVVHGGPGRRASTRELLAGVRAARRREVVVLPNDADSLGGRRGRRGTGPRRGAAGRRDPDPGQRPGARRARRPRPGAPLRGRRRRDDRGRRPLRHGGVTVASRASRDDGRRLPDRATCSASSTATSR